MCVCVYVFVCVCVYVCTRACEREKKKERKRERETIGLFFFLPFFFTFGIIALSNFSVNSVILSAYVMSFLSHSVLYV